MCPLITLQQVHNIISFKEILQSICFGNTMQEISYKIMSAMAKYQEDLYGSNESYQPVAVFLPTSIVLRQNTKKKLLCVHHIEVERAVMVIKTVFKNRGKGTGR